MPLAFCLAKQVSAALPATALSLALLSPTAQGQTGAESAVEPRAGTLEWAQVSAGQPLREVNEGGLTSLVADGQIFVPQAQELFDVALESGVTYAISMAGSPTYQGTLTDPLLRLRDAQGWEVAVNDDGGAGLNARIVYTPVASGLYTVVAGAYGSATGSYELRVERSPGFQDDYAGHSATAGLIQVGQSVFGTIDFGDDEDWFAVMLQAGVSYRIDLEGAPSGRGSLPDPLLTVHGETGRQLSANDDFGGTLNSQVTMTAPETGRYFINAQSFAFNTGSYTITVTPAGQFGTGGPVGDGK